MSRLRRIPASRCCRFHLPAIGLAVAATVAAVAAAAFLAFVPSAAPPSAPAPAATQPASAFAAQPASASQPAPAPQGWWAQASAAVERMEYRPSLAAGGLQAPNRAQGFRTWFHSDRVEIGPRAVAQAGAAPAWRWTWTTSAFGREDAMALVGPCEPSPTLARVEYARSGWTEWYENRESGLEQGFSIDRPPDGPDRPSGRLCIEGTIGGVLEGAAVEGAALQGAALQGAADRGTLTFSLAPSQASGPAALRYGSLAATDARGRSLPAEIDFAESRVRILVDDRDARYPIEIDPLIDVPAWEYRGDQYHLLAGERLSTLGDVNGDGFSDFALGLGRWDGPEGANQGRLFVYYGSPAGPSASPDWSADGQSDSCGFGFTVSTAGDVNADGYDDMIVCAFHERHEDGSRGTVYVYHGSPSGPTGPAWSVRTFAPDTTFTFGYGLALAGDVNGDGYSDVAISDYLHDGTFHRGGAVWVYHGSASGLEDSPAWMTEAENEAAFYGVSLSTAGDIDADGYDDLLVGSTHYHETGRVYLYRGSASGLSPTPSWTQDGTSYSYYGESVALAGDVNGDGYADVLVADLNSAHLFPGGAAGLGEEIWSRVGENPTTYCGDGLGTAGDVNGDGLADFLVGEPETMTIDGIGKAELFYGNRLEISTEPDWVFVADQPESRMGELVVTAGDVNGDGFSDFLVGEPMYSTEYEYDGRAYLFLGSGEGPRSSPGWVIEPNQVSASFGASIASAGDVNGDGCEDILVGAPGYDLGQVDEGAAFLFLGHGVGPSVVPDWYAEGNQQGAALGSAVAGAGDVDADGYDDVLIGAPDYDYSGIEDSGGAFIWRGTNEGPPPSGNPANANWRGQAAQVDAHYGQSVAWAGDVNGDGYADILIGVPGYSHGEASEGAAVIYHGSASGPPASPDWVAEGGQAGASYGWSVSTAGDANGDMFSDVVVGAPYMDNGLPDEGIAHVFLGHEEGASHVPAWQFEGEEQGGHLGWSVAHAGDVNGDSYSDLLIGMPEFSFAGEHCGLAMCFHGSEVGYAGHIPDEADWKIIGVAGGDRAGYCVAPAGDVDGDGYSDVLVSAPHAAWEGVGDAGLVAWEPGSPDGIQCLAATIGGAQSGADFGESVASADVNGDGFSDVLVGAPMHDQGQADEGRGFVYYGNRSRGLLRSPDQWRQDDTTPVGLLAFTDHWSGFGLRAVGRTPAGRDDVRLEWQVVRFGTPFTGSGIVSGATYDTGIPDSEPSIGSSIEIRETVHGLVGPRGWCWRMRMASRNPYFPRTPWFHATGNGAAEMDLRTGESPAAVEPVAGGVGGGSRLSLSCSPNPFRSGATIAWVQQEAGEARVTVHDLQGRLVRLLLNDAAEPPGEHRIVWDGKRSDGRRVPAGTYWIRVAAGGEEAHARVVRVE